MEAVDLWQVLEERSRWEESEETEVELIGKRMADGDDYK